MQDGIVLDDDMQFERQWPASAATISYMLRVMVERGGFEPPKASPADLQSAPFDHSGTSPQSNRLPAYQPGCESSPPYHRAQPKASEKCTGFTGTVELAMGFEPATC